MICLNLNTLNQVTESSLYADTSQDANLESRQKINIQYTNEDMPTRDLLLKIKQLKQFKNMKDE